MSFLDIEDIKSVVPKTSPSNMNETERMSLINRLAPQNDAVILLVDDDEDDQLIIGRVLSKAPISLETAHVMNGQQALDYLDSASAEDGPKFPDMVLLDLNMPIMDGNEFLKRLRNHPVYASLPVCVFTTSTEDEIIRKAYDCGANAVVSKVDSLEGMTQVLNTIVEFWFRTAQRYFVE